MAAKVLGLDIGDDLLTAVAVRRRGAEKKIAGFGVLPRDHNAPLGEQVQTLLTMVPWQGYTCITGLPLGEFSLRNLHVPFKARNKIAQILPFELEEQMPLPVEELAISFEPITATETGTNLLVTGLEKATLRHYLEILGENALDPEKVLPALLPLVWEVGGHHGGETGDGLVLFAGLHSVAMALHRQGKVVLLRRLAYSEQMFTHSPFLFQEDRVEVADPDQAAQCIRRMAASIRQSIDYFTLDHDPDIRPAIALLTGPMVLTPGFQEQVEELLGLKTVVCDLLAESSISMEEEEAARWRSPLHDRALALALAGFRKRIAYNLRTGEFSCRRKLSRSRQLVLAAAGGILIFLAVLIYQWSDYRRLHQRYVRLGREMEEIFRATFPEVHRVVDPLLQMEAKLQDVQPPVAVAPSLFNGEKRVLEILADISSRIPAQLSLHVSRLVIDRDSVQIKGTTDAFNNVDAIKSSLARSSRYREVKIVSATASKKTGAIRFEIRLQLQEAG